MKICKTLFITLFLISPLLFSQSEGGLPPALTRYDAATNSKDLDAYMGIFHPEMVMIDVGRVFQGHRAIRDWAAREVIPNGESFQVLEVVSQGPGYAKALVQWMVWEVYYYFWWDHEGKITQMSLQYQSAGITDSSEVYQQLPANVALYFDGVKIAQPLVLEKAFASQESRLRVVNRSFESLEGILDFAESEVYGGTYELVEILQNTTSALSVHLRFTPEGWQSPEPDAIYNFTLQEGKILSMNLQYK